MRACARRALVAAVTHRNNHSRCGSSRPDVTRGAPPRRGRQLRRGRDDLAVLVAPGGTAALLGTSGSRARRRIATRLRARATLGGPVRTLRDVLTGVALNPSIPEVRIPRGGKRASKTSNAAITLTLVNSWGTCERERGPQDWRGEVRPRPDAPIDAVDEGSVPRTSCAMPYGRRARAALDRTRLGWVGRRHGE